MRATKKSVAILTISICVMASQICCNKTSAAGQKTKLTLNHSRLLLQKGKKVTLKIKKGLPEGTSKNMIIFQSSNKKAATVDKNGKISAKKAGNAKITVKIKKKNLSAACNLRIVDKLEQISLKEPELTIKKGEKVNLTNFAVSEHQLTYSSDDNTMLKISADGMMQGLQAGVTTVTIKIKDSVKEPVYMNVKVLRDEYDTPLGFDEAKDNIPHGKITEVFYPSTVTGNTRKCMVYTPPEYSKEKKYNVLYCMHGIGGDHKEWYVHGSPQNILDNLYAENKLADMIVVFPNGRAMKDDSIPSNIYSAEAIAAFSNFENDLKLCLMPFINQNYSVYGDKAHTAMAGLSMGGMQTVNIGLKNLNLFDYYGIFSPAPTTDANLMGTDKSLYPKVIWLSVGTSDTTSGQMAINTDAILTQKGIDHIYYRMPGAHEWSVWKNGFYNFTQLIFK